MPTQNVNLPEHQADFIRQSVAGGRFGSASEVVRAGLRLLEQREREDALKLKALGQAVGDGFASIEAGEGVVLEDDEAIAAWFTQRSETWRAALEAEDAGGTPRDSDHADGSPRSDDSA
ncbi:MAG: type II toxin-antitoxin system ParD family antitoxin [Planctomycetota bacterium]